MARRWQGGKVESIRVRWAKHELENTWILYGAKLCTGYSGEIHCSTWGTAGRIYEARRHGYAKMFMSFQGEVRKNRGFDREDIAFLHKFFENNKDCIIDFVVEDKHKRKLRTWIPRRYIDNMRQ